MSLVRRINAILMSHEPILLRLLGLVHARASLPEKVESQSPDTNGRHADRSSVHGRFGAAGELGPFIRGGFLGFAVKCFESG